MIGDIAIRFEVSALITHHGLTCTDSNACLEVQRLFEELAIELVAKISVVYGTISWYLIQSKHW